MKFFQQRIVLALLVIMILALAFESGRQIEARQSRKTSKRALPPVASEMHPMAAHEIEDLNLDEIATVPFVDLYEQLRVASPEVRRVLGDKIEAMPHSPARESARFTFYKLLVQIDPAAAANAVESLKDDTETLRVVIGAAPQSAMEELAKMLLSLPGETWNNHFRGDYLSLILEKWSRVDPEAASRFIENYADVNFSGYVADIMENWAALDPIAAKAWLDRVDQSRLGPDPSNSFLSGWFQSAPRGAIQFAIAHASDDRFTDAASNLASRVFLRSTDEARDFVDAMPTERAKKDALSSIASVVGSFGSISDDEIRPPNIVPNWLLQFPPDLWGEAMSGVTREWREKDAQALFAWMMHLTPQAREQTVAGYSGYSTLPEEIGNIIAATMKAPDPQLREELLRRLADKLGSSPQEAIETLEQTKLGADEKAYMAKLISAR